VSRLRLYTRPGCHLCEQMRDELAPWSAARGLEVELSDVDTDPALRRRYGLRIPMLTLDDELICSGRLDLAALERRLAAPG
jgi:hypothetical protein